MKIFRFFYFLAFFLFLAIFIFSDSVTDWRKNIEIGDILYDIGGFVIDPDKGIDLPVIDPYKSGHVAIYVGDIEYGGIIWPRQIIEARASGGVYMIGVETWDYPTTEEAWILRVKTSKEIKQKAVEFAEGQIGKSYTRFNFFTANSSSDNDRWYCSELLWASYYQEGEGIDLSSIDTEEIFGLLNSPVSPQDIFNNNNVEAVGYHKGYNPIPEDAYRVFNLTLGKSYFSLKGAFSDLKFSSGQIIEISPGGYLENVEINKDSITLKARKYDQNKNRAETVIRSVKSGWQVLADLITTEDRPSSVVVNSFGVHLEGLTLTGAWGEKEYCGVRLEEGADYSQINNCILFNNPVGIGVNEVDELKISENRFFYNTYGIGMLRSYGSEIYLNQIENSFERGILAAEDESDCASESAVKKKDRTSALFTLRLLRDSRLSFKAISNYYKVSTEAVEIFSKEEGLKEEAGEIISKWSGKLKGFLEKGEDFFISENEALDFIYFLRRIEDLSEDSEVRFILNKIAKETEKFSGKKFGEAIKNSFYFSSEKKVISSAKTEPKRPTYFYLNNVVDNGNWSLGYGGGLFQWYSEQEIEYRYNGKMFKNFLGNYWSDNNSTLDRNGDGVYDEPFGEDEYSLVEEFKNFNIPSKEKEGEEVQVLDWIMY